MHQIPARRRMLLYSAQTQNDTGAPPQQAQLASKQAQGLYAPSSNLTCTAAHSVGRARLASSGLGLTRRHMKPKAGEALASRDRLPPAMSWRKTKQSAARCSNHEGSARGNLDEMPLRHRSEDRRDHDAHWGRLARWQGHRVLHGLAATCDGLSGRM